MRSHRARPRSGWLGLSLLAAACSADDGKPSGPTIIVVGGDAGTAADSASGADAGKKALAADCTSDSDCESGICFKGGKSSWCSAHCTAANAAQVCTGIFNGDCNQQGYCRRPN